jgi:hypothetical protein
VELSEMVDDIAPTIGDVVSAVIKSSGVMVGK